MSANVENTQSSGPSASPPDQQMATAPAPAPAATQVTECAVCWGEFSDESPVAVLPCHTSPAGATMQYCVRCIEIICETGPGGVGRCPTCRSFLKKSAEQAGTFEVTGRLETCVICNQPRPIVGEFRGRPLCDSCQLGMRLPLRYECQRCGRAQKIPHPMYRHQATPETFGNNSWACHARCGDFTFWRILPEDVALVPDAEAPESWGRRDEWFTRIREQRQAERAAGGRAAPAARADGEPRRWIDSWQGVFSLLLLVGTMLFAQSR